MTFVANKCRALVLALIVGLPACGDNTASHVETHAVVNFYNWFNPA